MGQKIEEELVHFLRTNSDVFAWSVHDLTRIDPRVMMHKLNVDPNSRPVRQKKRTFGQERNEIIKEEVEKLLTAGYIRPVQYPEWLANVVLVPKPNKKWRMCIDFTYLNRACPKDSYPLPRIDVLVDSTAGCEMMSFLDAFQRYNQISLESQDQEKTTFITEQGTFCYRVMPFGLNNTGATYQRLVNKAFKHMIGCNMEVYIDDMLVKSHSKDTHIQDLKECFEVVRRLRMKLNPSKCTFGVQGGKFLGYLISRRGIEANPEKIRAIQKMSPPTTKREIQKLTGRIAALSRFLSKGAERGLPLFKILRKAEAFSWTSECQGAFDELKKYLSKPPLLTKPRDKEALYMYLSTSEEAVSAVLVRAEEEEHQLVYYVSKVLQGAELNYSPIEKMALALVVAARKLRPYFQSHQVTVLTNQPLKHILASPNSSGRMTKWAVELREHGIEFEPRPAIKAQALADFISEITRTEEKMNNQEWKMFVDGSSTSSKSGVGIVIKSPEADYMEYAITLDFPASNNEAEYEAVLLESRLVRTAGAKKLRAFSDSQLVVSQAEGGYEEKKEKMMRYLAKLREEMNKIEEFQLEQIPREQNSTADQLAKLASSNQFVRKR
ncbi:UNVERIFIED_CONTAM: Transposon Ty3-G Gag-Pol polyprotein [Sesamum latifolium]|uniref:Transposon Ty3-G Gag-Pol polyprotein n=1 Tax=Sesamum latifolium TaxID=2727402 RepID=A0AAW2UHX4_9LAMI